MGYALDAQQELSKGHTLTATGNSQESLDFGADRNVGVGEPLAVFFKVGAIAGGGVYTAAIETADDDDFTGADVATVGTITINSANANTAYVQYLPKDNTVKRFLRLRLTIGGSSPSINYDAYLVPASTVHAWTSYPANYTIVTA